MLATFRVVLLFVFRGPHTKEANLKQIRGKLDARLAAEAKANLYFERRVTLQEHLAARIEGSFRPKELTVPDGKSTRRKTGTFVRFFLVS